MCQLDKSITFRQSLSSFLRPSWSGSRQWTPPTRRSEKQCILVFRWIAKKTNFKLNIFQVYIIDYKITALRLHPDYILYYTMWTRLLITGIFPFAMLAGLYTKIYLAMRRSRAQLRTMAIRAALPMAILGN